MSKTLKRCYFDNLDIDKLYNAYLRARKNKRNKKEVIDFSLNLETNLIKIYNDLRYLTYKPGKYKKFIIHEPKERLIMSLPFKDRVIHQWYIEEFIKPFYVKRFINDSYACIEGRGTHKAVFKLQKYLKENNNKEFYLLKCDIEKYFFNIDKDILFNILKRDIKDKYLLELTKKIIFDNIDNGLPIGNYTSQYFANIYLNELDWFIKDNLGVKYYIRYMDDFIFLLDSKEECKLVLDEIRKILNNNLKLNLNKKTRYFKYDNGIDFCGYIVYSDKLIPRKRNIKKIFKIINNFNINDDLLKFYFSMNSYLSYLEYTKCYNLKKVIINRIIKCLNLI